MDEDLAVLRRRGAPAPLIEQLAASGLPARAARRAVERGGWRDRLRRMLRPEAPWSVNERARLDRVAALAASIAADAGGADAARRFWSAGMAWFDGEAPAAVLARGEIEAVTELQTRINDGIPP